jgi:hypothetical protein
MARGDAATFEELSLYAGKGEHDFSSDTFKVALITDGTAIAASDSDPAYMDWTECANGGGYTTGGETLANVSYTEAAGVATFDADDVTWTKTAGSPTDCYYAVVYNDTNGSKRAVLFIDLGGPVSIVDGDLTLSFNASGIATVTVTA